MESTIRIPVSRPRPGLGLLGSHKVVTEELLDYLAERFITRRVRELTRCTFEQYVRQPSSWERIAEALLNGWGVRFNPECPGIVALIPPGGASVH
ncbi:MAG: hypothetical protein AAGU11_18305 [Syntrophobacteraceae bacterium]